MEFAPTSKIVGANSMFALRQHSKWNPGFSSQQRCGRM
jgi:hypothetical protein